MGRKGKKILDLGYRDGELTKYFNYGNSMLGVNIGRKALSLVKEKLGIETKWLDINTEFPFENESFGVVVACEIMEHIYHTKQFIEKIHHVLKPGGLFLGSVPNSFRDRNRLKFLMGKDFETDPTHIHMFSFTKLNDLLLCHFNNISIHPFKRQHKILS